MHKRSFFDDMDPAETREWLEALESVVEREGPERDAWQRGDVCAPQTGSRHSDR